jgi:hypothetical protein
MVGLKVGFWKFCDLLVPHVSAEVIIISYENYISIYDLGRF